MGCVIESGGSRWGRGCKGGKRVEGRWLKKVGGRE